MPKGGAKPRPTIKKLYDERQALAETKIRPNTSRRPSLGERPEPEREDPGTTRRSNEQEQRTTLEGLRKLQEFAKLNFTKAEAKAATYMGLARDVDDAAGSGVANHHRLLGPSLCRSPKLARTIPGFVGGPEAEPGDR